MKLLFDFQAFEMQRIGGVSRSYVELISRLQEEGCGCMVGIKESDNVYLREKGLVKRMRPLHYRHKRLFEGKKLFKGQRTLVRKILNLWGETNDYLQINKEYCVDLLNRQRFDVFEPTFFDSYFLPYLKDKPFVLTIHDMIPELYPSYFSRDDYQIVQKKVLCPLAAHIHVPSENTKRDLVNILNIDPYKITVVPHGRPDYTNNNSLTQPLFDFPYILFVGDRYGYKNYSTFLKECSKIIMRFPEIRIVCTGKEFSFDEKREITALGLDENVIHRFVDEESLRNLYHYAVAFIYPSAYEGFGIPILEAFANDCPVMLNSASCFPEIAGDGAIYFDINKDGELYERFIKLYQSGSEERTRMIELGRSRVQDYSWEKSAKMMLNIYKSLA